MEVFQFKKFKIKQNSASVFKVNTEAVLLAAWTNLENCQSVLEIGSGTGVISIGLKQRQQSSTHITCIDIDFDSYRLTKENIELNQLENILPIHISLQEFYSKNKLSRFHLIISNPPYFTTKYKSEKKRNLLSKYSDSLNYQTLIDLSSRLLLKDGKLALVLPFTDLTSILQILDLYNFQIVRQLNIRTTPRKNPLRVLVEIRSQDCNISHTEVSELLVKDSQNMFTEAYREMTKDYYTIF